MAAFGAIGSAENIPYDEEYFDVAFSQAVATNGAANVTIGTYTMPVTGLLVAHFLVHSTWTANIQGTGQSLAPSTPAPTAEFAGITIENGQIGTMISIGPVIAMWPSVTVGTVVTLRVRVSASFFAPTVTFDHVIGCVRASRA